MFSVPLGFGLERQLMWDDLLFGKRKTGSLVVRSGSTQTRCCRDKHLYARHLASRHFYIYDSSALPIVAARHVHLNSRVRD